MDREPWRRLTVRLLVCGARTWTDWLSIIHQLKAMAPAVVIHGRCRGVDLIAGTVAKDLGIAVAEYAVDHALDGPWPSAGPRRNRRMFNESKPTHGLAFGPLVRQPGSARTTGTGDMVRVMRRAGIPVQWVAEPGAAAIDLAPLAAKER